MKTIILDGGALMFKAITLKGGLLKRKAEGELPKDHFIAPIKHTYMSMAISCLKRIGVNEDDTIIMAIDARNSWRKAFYQKYKGQRKELRDKQEYVNWDKAFAEIDEINNELEASTDWHFLKFDNVLNLLDILQTKEGKDLIGEDYTDDMFDWDYGLEADDIQAVACKVFKDKEVILATGDCLSGTTLIRMAQGGSKPLSKVRVGDEVLSFDEKNNKFVSGKVLHKLKKKHKEQYNIYYDDYKTPIKSSANHKFYTKQGWKKAQDLNAGDVLYHHKNKAFPYNNMQNNYKVGYILGLVNGDGWIDEKQKCLWFEMCDLEPLERVQEYISNLFNYRAEIKKTKITQGLKQAYRIRFYLNYHFDYLMKYKDIDSISYKKGYCAGFYDAEGCLSETAQQTAIHFDQKNTKPYLYDIKNYLNLLDIKSSKIFEANPSIERFCLTGNEVLKFLNICKPAIKRKYPFWKYHYSYLQNGRTIKKIEIIEDNFLHHDLSINKYHTYVIEGDIIVHNCDLYQLSYFENVKIWSFNLKKIKQGTGGYAQIKSPLSIIADKVRLGDLSDNIIVDKIADTELEQKRREFIINLLDLPEWVYNPIAEVLKSLPKKEIFKEKLPYPTSLAIRFWEIYKEDKIVTFEYCKELMAKREVRKKKKQREKYLEKKTKEWKERCENKKIEELTKRELKSLEKYGLLEILFPKILKTVKTN